MNKQDRHGVRSPMDLERKYDFGLIFGDNPNSYLKMIEKVGKLVEETDKLIKETEELKDKLSEVFPVDSLYISLDSTNPSYMLDGTWRLFSEGYLVLGDDESTLLQSEEKCYVWKRTA